MKHLGDITKLDGHKVPLVDIVTGGSPCQDLSVAGKRKGLSGERSGLFMEQIRIIKEMRDESTKQLRSRGTAFDIRDIQPRYMVWENVPGAFSSNKGEDFKAVLEETAKVAEETAVIPGPEGGRWSPSGCIMGNGWSIAWRVHDAQFWGVPQRRKRIALVADFGGESAPEILFERKGLSGDSEPSREERKDSSGDTLQNSDKAGSISFQERAGKPGGVKEYSYNTTESEPSQPLTTKPYSIDEKMGQTYIHEDQGNTLSARDYKQPQAVCYDMDNERRRGPDEFVNQSPALTARAGTGGNNVPAVVFGISGYESNAMKSSNPHSGIYEADSTRTLDNNGGNPACNQGGMIVLEGNGSRESHRGDGYKESDISYTLNAVEQHAVCYQDKTGTLNPGAHAGSYNGQDAYNDMLIVGVTQDSYDKYTESEKAATIKNNGGNYGGGAKPL